MNYLDNLTIEAANQVKDLVPSQILNKKFLSASKFLAMMPLVLASFSNPAFASDKYLPTKILGGITAINVVTGNEGGAKVAGAATLGAAVGSQIGGGKTAPKIFSLLGATIAGTAASRAIHNNQVNGTAFNKHNPNTDQFGQPQIPTGNPNFEAPLNIRQVKSTILYKVTGEQNFFVTIDNSPAIQFLNGNIENTKIQLDPRSKEYKNLQQAYEDLELAYAKMEQSGVNFSQQAFSTINSQQLENQNSAFSYNQIRNPQANSYTNNLSKLNSLKHEHSINSNNYFKVRGPVMAIFDNAVVAGYDISQWESIKYIVTPSENSDKLLRKVNSYPNILSGNTLLKIR